MMEFDVKDWNRKAVDLIKRNKALLNKIATHSSTPAEELAERQKEWHTVINEVVRKEREQFARELIEWRHISSQKHTIQEVWELEHEHLCSISRESLRGER